jgi:hypothetical protein
MVELVERMLDLHKQLKSTPDDARVKARIADTDKEIDELVYNLYGLTKDEIKIVESK